MKRIFQGAKDAAMSQSRSLSVLPASFHSSSIFHHRSCEGSELKIKRVKEELARANKEYSNVHAEFLYCTSVPTAEKHKLLNQLQRWSEKSLNLQKELVELEKTAEEEALQQKQSEWNKTVASYS